jgi:hypothetical protein
MGAYVSLEFVLQDQFRYGLEKLLADLGFVLDYSAIVCPDVHDANCEFVGIQEYRPTILVKSWDPRFPLQHLMDLGSSFHIGMYINQDGFALGVGWDGDRATLSIELDRTEVIYKGSGWRTLDVAKAAPIIDPIIKSFKYAEEVRIIATNL